jgi:hypothetical protein
MLSKLKEKTSVRAQYPPDIGYISLENKSNSHGHSFSLMSLQHFKGKTSQVRRDTRENFRFKETAIIKTEFKVERPSLNL